jgi:heptosyltransferase II
MSGAATVEPRRILVKATNWLGDLVISLPALRAVRRAFPRATLAVLVKEDLGGFFAGLDWVDEVLRYRLQSGLAGVGDRRRIIAEVRAARFELAIVFPKSFESALWVALAGVPRRAGLATQGRGVLLTDRAWPRDTNTDHQADDYLQMLGDALGIQGGADDVALEVAADRRMRMREWLRARRRSEGPLIALAPAAAYGPAKEWPAQRYTSLVDRLGERSAVECVLVGTPAERARCEEIAAASRTGAIVAAGETDVGDLVALLSLCQGFAGNDSGAMHVAGALGIPTVGIFGSTDAQRTAPLGPLTRVLYERIECSPCLDRTCRFGHYDCLKRISIEAVVDSLSSFGAIR